MLPHEEDAVVSCQIHGLEKRIFDLEKVENKLQSKLNTVQQQLSGLRHERDVLRSKQAPIWTLPFELLSLIFKMGAQLEEEELEDSLLEETPLPVVGSPHELKHHFAIVVSHVCRAFRDAATSTTTLWTKIFVLYPNEAWLHRTKAYVDRSGAAPLTVLVGGGLLGLKETKPAGTSEEGDYKKLMEILQPHIPRFQVFAVDNSNFSLLHFMMQYLDKSAPLLESLDICERNYEREFEEFEEFPHPELRKPLVIFGGEMPKLKRLVMDGVHVDWERCNFRGLTTIIFCYHTRDVRISYDVFRTMITASPELVHLDFRGSGPVLPEAGSDVSLLLPIAMDKLDRLHLSDIPCEDLLPLAELLQAPNLKILSMSNLDKMDFSEFLLRLAEPPILYPNVTELKMSRITCEDEAFVFLLKAYPNLIRLTLNGDDELTDLLKPGPPNGSGLLCPKLQTIRCISGFAEDLKSVVKERKEAGCPLEAIEIDMSLQSNSRKKDLEWLEANTKVTVVVPSDDEMISDDTDTETSDTDESDDSDWHSEGFILPWFLHDDDDEVGDGDENEWETEIDSNSEMEMDVDDEDSDQDFED